MGRSRLDQRLSGGTGVRLSQTWNLRSSFGCRDSFEGGLWLFVPMRFLVSGSSHLPGVVNALPGLQVWWVDSANLAPLKRRLLWCGFQRLMPPLSAGSPEGLDAGARLWKWGTCSRALLPEPDFS